MYVRPLRIPIERLSKPCSLWQALRRGPYVVGWAILIGFFAYAIVLARRSHL